MKKRIIRWVLDSVLDLVSVALNELTEKSETTVDDNFVITFAENKEGIRDLILSKL